MAARILIVDDDPNIREVIGFALENVGYSISTADNGLAAIEIVNATNPDLIVLDIGLPEMDGLDVCRKVRRSSEVPILFLTARDDEIDRIIGLEIGGDDYVTKPFSPRELVARIKAILKRVSPVAAPKKPAFVQGELEIDVERHLCRVANVAVTLTASEFGLLKALMAKPENVLSRQQLTDAVYGNNVHVSDRTIDSHIRNIRSKLSKAGCPESIITVHGVGLRMGSCRTE